MLNKNVSIISVSQLNNYIKRIFDDSSVLNNVLVKGEISNLKYHPSGHIYFSLKDNESVVKCVMFSSYTGNLNFKLNEGDRVIVNGTLSVYVQGGSYQIYVKNMEKDGKTTASWQISASKPIPALTAKRRILFLYRISPTSIRTRLGHFNMFLSADSGSVGSCSPRAKSLLEPIGI